MTRWSWDRILLESKFLLLGIIIILRTDYYYYYCNYFGRIYYLVQNVTSLNLSHISFSIPSLSNSIVISVKLKAKFRSSFAMLLLLIVEN
jgi:hypothetical protein